MPGGAVDGYDGAPTTTPVATPMLGLTVPREVLQYAPLLAGRYCVQDKRAVWRGRWGMTEAAFGKNGITSEFEMKSQVDVFLHQSGDAGAEAAAARMHPAFRGALLARSQETQNANVAHVSPVFLGYETKPEAYSAMPFEAKYDGYFQIQVVKGKMQTVTEKDVLIRFVHDVEHPHQFVVSGVGENRFGIFELHGTLDKCTNDLRMYKVYKPKEKEKRTQPRRGRLSRVSSSLSDSTLKVQTQPAAAPTPSPVTAALVTPPATTAKVRDVEPTPAAAQRTLSAPMTDYRSTSVVSRGRSERKRSVPAHLREDNVLEHEKVPVSLKKCYSILKSLMANPKAGPFLVPVDPVALGIPDYFQVIKEPMDLGSIRQNLEIGAYEDPAVFVQHVRLVFDNAMLYNAAHSQVHLFARKLTEEFEKRIKKLEFTPIPKTLQKQSAGVKTTKKDKKVKSSSKKSNGSKSSKSSSKKRGAGSEDQELIMSLKEDLERLKAKLEQFEQPPQPPPVQRTAKAPSRRFKMEDLTEDELSEPMTQMEKARLSSDIKSLPPDKINRVLQIIAETMPVAKLVNENDEIELDINAFDTRCLRMLEGYVWENGIGRKRKRPAPSKPKVSAAESRLKSAKMAALNIRSRKEELKSQLAAMEGELTGAERPASAAQDVVMADVSGDAAPQNGVDADGASSDSGSSSSSSSSDSSGSDSESDSDSDEAPNQQSPSLVLPSTLSQVDGAKKIRDEAPAEPLRVENRGAWSLLAQQRNASNGKSLIQSEEEHSSSLWMSARSMEQIKQQKLQQQEKERSEELEAQRRREMEQREKEKVREREEMERRKQEQEAALRLAQEERQREERAREAERVRASQRAKAKLTRENELEHEQALTEDLETFSSSSFL